jgi:hypothetical protein
MLEMGASTQDAGFVGGWYRMSSYGWPIGFLSGLVNIESGAEIVSQCDLLASDPYDPRRRAPGLLLQEIDAVAAETACREETGRAADDMRATYQLARVMSSDSERSSEYVPLAEAAAKEGVSPAFTLIAEALDAKSDDRSGQAYVAASQHTIIESFPILYPYLESRATNARQRTGLTWYAEKAAALGVPEAHFALASDASDDVTKLVHMRLAARLWESAGNWTAAEEANRAAAAITLSAKDAEAVDSRVAEWTGEALVELPDDVGSS